MRQNVRCTASVAPHTAPPVPRPVPVQVYSAMATPEALAAALREAQAATTAARAATAAAEAATDCANQLIRELQCVSPPRSAPTRARSSLSLGEMRPTTSEGAGTPRQARVLPRRIFILRHGESEGNVDESMYSRVADPEIKLTPRGISQAEAAGRAIRERCEADGSYRLFFYFSPYMRTKQVSLTSGACGLRTHALTGRAARLRADVRRRHVPVPRVTRVWRA